MLTAKRISISVDKKHVRQFKISNLRNYCDPLREILFAAHE